MGEHLTPIEAALNAASIRWLRNARTRLHRARYALDVSRRLKGAAGYPDDEVAQVQARIVRLEQDVAMLIAEAQAH